MGEAEILELSASDPVDWCEKNIQLDYGSFDRDNHPLMTEPLPAGPNTPNLSLIHI